MTPTPTPPVANDFENLPGYTPNDDEKLWALLAHLSGIIVSFLGPLVVMLVKGNESKWVKAHAIEALNFNLVLFVAYSVSGFMTMLVIGLCMLPVVAIVSLILSIVAGAKGYGGHAYRYPFNVRLIKE